jgi:hypothetical protein
MRSRTTTTHSGTARFRAPATAAVAVVLAGAVTTTALLAAPLDLERRTRDGDIAGYCQTKST